MTSFFEMIGRQITSAFDWLTSIKIIGDATFITILIVIILIIFVVKILKS